MSSATSLAPVNPEPEGSSAIVDQNRLEKKTFRAHGAAAEIWIVESLTEPVTKCISKIIRLDEESLQRYHNPRSKTSANELWKGFLQDIQYRVNEWLPVRHKNVIQIFGLHEGLDLRVEYCSNGTAFQFLNENVSNQIVCRRNMIFDVVKGVAHLHNQDPPIVHGSINMNKLFVDDAGTTKIGEFGLSALTSHFALHLPVISQVEVSRWMSPELVDPDTEDGIAKPTSASDMWALGCTLFEVLSGKLPYPECKHELRVCTEIASGKLPGRRDLCLSSELEYVWPNLEICWSSTPDSRPTARDLEISLSSGPQSLKVDDMETGNRLIPEPENPQIQPPAGPTETPSEALQKQLSSKIFALVIGINAYFQSGSKTEELDGAVADADAIAQFLTDDLNVPPDHITNLRNELATREAIINAIEDLFEYARIERGDAILIYFAGHGGQVDASARWKAKTGADKIQVICPYDQGKRKSNEIVYPIPDRTIRALINKLSREKGDNIILILDSCHLTSANRQQYRARGAEITMEIPDDLDDELIANEEASHQHDEGARGIMPMYQDQASHIFLAACDPKGFAWEEGGRGLFTTALLETIQANEVNNITYENLLAALPQLPHNQSPHLSGKHKSRILFNAHAPTEKSPSLGTLRENKPTIASTPPIDGGTMSLGGEQQAGTPLYARQGWAGAGHKMKVHFTADAKQLLELGSNKDASGEDPGATSYPILPECMHVECDQESADMIVGVSTSSTKGPEITFTPRSEVDAVLAKASAWNLNLEHKNLFGTDDPAVNLQIAKLEDFQKGVDEAEASNLQVKNNLYDSKDKVARIRVVPGEELEYGIKVINITRRSLYVRMFYYDVPNFSIMEIGPEVLANGQKAVKVPPKGEFLIGDSSDGGRSIVFGVSEDNMVEFGFIKVVWSTMPFELHDSELSRGLVLQSPASPISGTLIATVVLDSRTSTLSDS